MDGGERIVAILIMSLAVMSLAAMSYSTGKNRLQIECVMKAQTPELAAYCYGTPGVRIQ